MVESYVKTRYDDDLEKDDVVRSTYKLIVGAFYPNIRISSFMEMLKRAFYIYEWLLFDPKTTDNYKIEAYLMDRLKDFIDGKPIDFVTIYNKLIDECDFLESEKFQFTEGNVEKRIYAIYLALVDPHKKLI